MRRFGAALNGVSEPHRRESHVGKIATIGDGGRSLAVTNANNSQLRNLVPIMPYGISSSPTPGLMAFVLVSQDSSRDGIVGVYDPNKPKCKPGEIIIYSSGGATIRCSGDKIYINDRDILKELDELKGSTQSE